MIPQRSIAAVSPSSHLQTIGTAQRNVSSSPPILNSSISSNSLSSMFSSTSTSSSDDDDVIPRFTMEEVERHDDLDSCWIVVIDFVFDITEFVERHPGGVEVSTSTMMVDKYFSNPASFDCAQLCLTNDQAGSLISCYLRM